MNQLRSYKQKVAALAARSPAVAIGGCAILPIVLIAISAQLFDAYLRDRIPKVDLTVFGALWHVLHRYVWSGDDSWMPMQRALEILQGPSSHALYEALFFREHVRFQYPVTSLLPIEMLDKLGVGTVFALNAINLGIFLLNAVAVGVFAFFMTSDSGARASGLKWSDRERKKFALVSGLVALVFYPIVRACVLGQIQVWVDFLFTCALIFWVLGRKASCGLVLGLASAIKPQLGLLLVWAILWREWKFVRGFILGFAPVAVIAAVLYGIHNSVFYVNVLSFLAKHGESFYANNSINGILNWYFSGTSSQQWNGKEFPPSNGIVHLGTLASSVAFLLPILVPPFLKGRTDASLTFLAIGAICTVVGSPVAWEHHYGIVLPLYLIALRDALSEDSGRAKYAILGALGISWILVANFIPFALLFAQSALVFLQAYCFFGAVLLLGVLLIMARASRPERREDTALDFKLMNGG